MNNSMPSFIYYHAKWPESITFAWICFFVPQFEKYTFFTIACFHWILIFCISLQILYNLMDEL